MAANISQRPVQNPTDKTCKRKQSTLELPLPMLQNIAGCQFHHSVFTQAKTINCSVQYVVQGSDPINTLSEFIARGASHDSADRSNSPRCYPETRLAVIEKVELWVRGNSIRHPILWLHGPAGAGKSAIAQTLADKWKDHHLLLASFFFSRYIDRRNEKRCFIPTIAYQLAISSPSLRQHIAAAIIADPKIFEASLKTQVTKLVTEPLVLVSRQSQYSCPPVVIIVDGLDECSLDYEGQPHEGQQREILEALAFATKEGLPLRILIVSRPERQLRESFSAEPLQRITEVLQLDHRFNPNNDIQLFLRESFSAIRKERKITGPQWPSDEMISRLVQNSSGQFIYASTAVRYIGDPHGDPKQKLEVILGLQIPHDAENPFKELDTLYLHILQTVPKTSLHQVLWILEYLRFIVREWSWSHISPFPRLQSYSPRFLEKLLFIPPGMIYTHLNNLHSILEIPPIESSTSRPIRFIHASFIDFLSDPARSGRFFISRVPARLRCQINLLRHIFCISSKDYHDPSYDEEGIIRAFVWGLWFDLTSLDSSPCINLAAELKKGLDAALSKNENTYTRYLESIGMHFLGLERRISLRHRLAPYQQRWVLKLLQRFNVKEIEPSAVQRWFTGLKLRRQIAQLPEVGYTYTFGSPVVIAGLRSQ